MRTDRVRIRPDHWDLLRGRSGRVVGHVDGDVLVELDGDPRHLRFAADAVEPETSMTGAE